MEPGFRCNRLNRLKERDILNIKKRSSKITYHETHLQPDSSSAANDSLDGICEALGQVFAEKYDELIFTRCGTPLYLAQAVAHAFSTYDAVLARTMCYSELYYFPENYMKGRKVLVPPITRKSHAAEMRMAISKVRSFLGVRTPAIACDGDSVLYNGYVILSPDTVKDSVIMTHSFTNMVYLAAVIAVYTGDRKGEVEAMAGYAVNVRDALRKMDDTVKKIIAEHGYLRLYIILGQDAFCGVANECMNKMKEMGLTDSEAYYTLEYHHGPMSLVDGDTPVLLPRSEHTVDGDGKLLIEMKNYRAVTTTISNHVSMDSADTGYTLGLPCEYNGVQNAALIGLTGQFMGYYVTGKKGLDVDTPRHLSQAIVIK